MASNHQGTPPRGHSTRGFASIDPERQREVEPLGGQAVRGQRPPQQPVPEEPGQRLRTADPAGRSMRRRRS